MNVFYDSYTNTYMCELMLEYMYMFAENSDNTTVSLLR